MNMPIDMTIRLIEEGTRDQIDVRMQWGPLPLPRKGEAITLDMTNIIATADRLRYMGGPKTATRVPQLIEGIVSQVIYRRFYVPVDPDNQRVQWSVLIAVV